ncbi:MAG: class I SAM-dependent methyltransferase [Candidatus Scalindua sp.]|nr:class I SAM-dependent methyltransferase [Candidatus Scalindua sp.]
MTKESENTDYSHLIDNKERITQCYVCNSGKIFFFKKVHGFSVYKCKTCKLIWVGDAINEKKLKSFYSSNYYTNFYVKRTGFKNYVGNEKNYRKNSRNNIDIISKVKKIDFLRVLDIGCACGFYIDEIKKLKKCDVYGVEFSEWAIQYATENLGLKNIFFQEKHDQFHFENNYFDIVFLLGTIEHVINPREMLVEINRILKPEGLLMITTLDTKSSIPFYLIKPPEHFYYFNHHNLPVLLKRMGFKTLINQSYFSHYYVFEIFQVLSNLPFLSSVKPLSSLIYKLFPDLSIKSPTNEMVLVAQKGETE